MTPTTVRVTALMFAGCRPSAGAGGALVGKREHDFDHRDGGHSHVRGMLALADAELPRTPRPSMTCAASASMTSTTVEVATFVFTPLFAEADGTWTDDSKPTCGLAVRARGTTAPARCPRSRRRAPSARSAATRRCSVLRIWPPALRPGPVQPGRRLASEHR